MHGVCGGRNSLSKGTEVGLNLVCSGEARQLSANIPVVSGVVCRGRSKEGNGCGIFLRHFGVKTSVGL